MAISDDELIQLIEAGEARRVEFKGRRALGEERVEVIRGVLAMSNLRDGGILLIGVERDRTVSGLTDEQAQSWRNQERARQILAGYAEPAVDFHVTVRPITVGDQIRTIALIEVRQFEDFPVVCIGNARRGDEQVLREGAVYVRNQIPASVEIEDHSQMRELLDLAIEKGVRRFLRTADAVGLGAQQIQELITQTVAATVAALTAVPPVPAQAAPVVAPDDDAEFARQLEDFDRE
jgi:predicted HTH transcriptional regulator